MLKQYFAFFFYYNCANFNDVRNVLRIYIICAVVDA